MAGMQVSRLGQCSCTVDRVDSRYYLDLDMSAYKARVADVPRVGVHGPGLRDGDDQAGGERH